MKILKYFFISLFSLFSLFNSSESENSITNGWISPDIWGRSSQNHEFIPSCSTCDCENKSNKNQLDNISFIYYKKLIHFFTNLENLEFDENTKTYYRAIKYKITESQINKLKKSIDPRDWDSIFSEILSNVKTYKVFEKEKTSWLNSIINFVINVWSSLFYIDKIRFELLLITALLLIIYLKRFCGLSLVVIILSGIFLGGFIYKYYECNKKLEIDELLDIYDVKDNPCDDKWQNQQLNFWNLWGFLLMKSSKSQCLEYLQKKNKVKLPFCRPDDVFLSYINEIILNQFKMTVEKSTNIFKDINQLIPFPYNIVASIIFCLTLIQFLNLFFKYIISPKNWSSYWWYTKKINYIPNEQCNNCQNTLQQQIQQNKDLISGENLKNFLELLKFKIEEPTKNKIDDINVETSGVQVLKSLKENNLNIIKNNNNNENNSNEEKIETLSEKSPSKTVVANNSENYDGTKSSDNDENISQCFTENQEESDISTIKDDAIKDDFDIEKLT